MDVNKYRSNTHSAKKEWNSCKKKWKDETQNTVKYNKEEQERSETDGRYPKCKSVKA